MPSTEISTLSYTTLFRSVPAAPAMVRASTELSAEDIGGIADACHACAARRSEEHTSELQSRLHLVCRPPRSPLFPTRRSSDLYQLHPPWCAHQPSCPPKTSAASPMPATPARRGDRKSTRLNSSHGYISYAVHRDLHSFLHDALPICTSCTRHGARINRAVRRRHRRHRRCLPRLRGE